MQEIQKHYKSRQSEHLEKDYCSESDSQIELIKTIHRKLRRPDPRSVDDEHNRDDMFIVIPEMERKNHFHHMHNLPVPKRQEKVKPLSPFNEEGKQSLRNHLKTRQKEDTQVKNT